MHAIFQIHEEFDPFIESYFSFLRIILGITGNWPFSSTKNEKRFNLTWSVILNSLSIFVCYGELVNLLDPNIDIFGATEGICVAVTAIIAVMKNLVFMFKGKQLKSMFYISNDLYKNIPIEKNNEIIRITERNKKICHTTSKLFLTCCFFVVLIYATLPMVKLYLYNIKGMPYPSQFPYINMDSWYAFWILYVTEIFVGISVILTFAGDTLFVALILLLCSSLHTLKYSVEAATHEAKLFNKRSELFVKCVQYHKKILR